MNELVLCIISSTKPVCYIYICLCSSEYGEHLKVSLPAYVQDTVSQNGKEIKRLNDNLAKAETEHKTTRALKESAEKERNTAKQNVMQSKVGRRQCLNSSGQSEYTFD